MNELTWFWRQWDKCFQHGESLTQFMSDYCDIVLKLHGIDDFQQIRGFLRDLDAPYEREVRPCDPKYIEEAISFVQIYDDTHILISFARYSSM